LYLSFQVTHTDLKPENILFVTNDWHYVEADAGCGPSNSSSSSNKNNNNNNGKQQQRLLRRMRDTRVKLIDFGKE